MLGSTSHSLRRPLVALLMVALLVAMAAAVGRPAPASAGDPASGPVRVGPSTGSWYNPVAPRLERIRNQQEALGRLDRGAGTASLAPSAKVLAQADAFDRKHSAGNPSAADQCVTEPAGTLLGGPVHNQLPNPATAGRGTDNNSFWVPDFSPSHYDRLIYTTTGLTQRVRPT